ncbi:MAG: glycoside hydrolase family 31 protein [Chitinophagales bacterium]
MSPNNIIQHQNNKELQQVIFTSENKVLLQIGLLSERMLRFRYSTAGYFLKDFSYAIDPAFSKEEIVYQVKEYEHYFLLQTAQLFVEIAKENLKVSIKDTYGNMLCEDAAGFTWETEENYGGIQPSMSKVTEAGECFYGLGDKSGQLNLQGQKVQCWNTDAFAYERDTDPLYKTVPFYYSLNNGQAYGIFFDNSFRSHFDFNNTVNEQTIFSATGGEMNYYFLYGPELVEVAQQYHELTGTHEMPPLWALGYHQCKWSYRNEERVRTLAKNFRKHQVPCDAIYLDIDYMDEYRCFTWNKEHFPQLKKLITDLQEDGFKTVVMIDPGIKVDKDYWVWKEAFDKDYFCKRADGSLVKEAVWPPECHYPDFTRHDVREWWGGLYREFALEKGIYGFWNDMNEPAAFNESKTVPDDVRHHYEGNHTSHRKGHNIYGMQMVRATQEGLKKLQPNKRPFTITRATYAGGQRYSTVWTGDNISTWEHLHIASVQCQRLSLSGYSFTGSDIGGFFGECTGELFVRWIQLAVFHPLFRAHCIGFLQPHMLELYPGRTDSYNDEEIPREPWNYGEENLKIARKAIELRYQLLPYLYTAFWKNTTQGTPVLQSLVFVDQHDENTHNREGEFIVGDHILVSPITEEGITEKAVYLPEGAWYDFWNNQIHQGGQEVTVRASLDGIPIFVQAGAVLAFAPVKQYVEEKSSVETTLHIYYKEGLQTTEFYEDAGDGYGYETGDYLLRAFKLDGEDDELEVTQTREGNYDSPSQTFTVKLHGLPFEVKEVSVDGEEVTVSPDGSFSVPSNFGELAIE